MNRSFLALALALGMIPAAGFAQDANAVAPTTDQRQTMHQTFERFAAQEEQLHQQMRWQMLSSLSPVHRRAVGAAIGDLAIAPSPDPEAAAKRLDSMLSPGEQQRVIAAHSTFVSQSRQLHDQMRTELQNEMPAGAQSGFMKHGPDGAQMAPRQFDAGTLLLMALTPRPMGMGMHHPWMMMRPEGPPPE
ncbi:MAG TPA: hypothetical protein VMU38_02865 [Candidatus Binatia bacterium]|nr:hypothetical protein [Candidatus Binatia bacterium]